MSNLINLKKLTANSLIGLLLAGGLVIESGTRKAIARACDNNGHGNNGDIVITLSSGREVLLTKFDPSNPGNGNKIEREIKDSNPGISRRDLREAKNIILQGAGQYDYERLPTNGVDSDCDGIDDYDEVGSDINNPLDTDNDGTPNFLDTDSDNDGISDSAEGTGDTDGDGIPDYLDAVDNSTNNTDETNNNTNGTDSNNNNGTDVFGIELRYLDSAFQCGSNDPRQADIKVEVYDKNNNLLTTLSKGDTFTSADFDSIEDLEFDYRIYNFTHCGWSNGERQGVGGSELLGANDTVPDVGGYSGQASIREMLSDLDSYEELYLVELGTSDRSSAAYDLQDVVLVVDNNPEVLTPTSGITVSIEAPGVQSPQLLNNDYYVIDFDDRNNGTEGFNYTNRGTTYTYSSDLQVKNANQWGGADGSKFITQAPLQSIRSYKVNIDKDQRYFGFWWSAGDPHNKITFKHQGKEVAVFKTQDLVGFINDSGVNNTSAYYGNPSYNGNQTGHTREPFAFVNIFFNEGVYDEIVVATLSSGGAAFESDNHTFSATQQAIIGTVLQSEDPDTDSDGVVDRLDSAPDNPDRDNDGLLDGNDAAPDNPDRDNDGLLDGEDTDPDNPNNDSDQDGIPDSIEIGSDPNNPRNSDKGLQEDGSPHPDSSYNDGDPDYLDTDSDNNGIPDSVEAGDNPTNPTDSDQDGIPDFQDTDDDNNGIFDVKEIGNDPSSNDGYDLDGDGIPDIYPNDFDADGIPDYLDKDDDNDYILDSVEIGANPNKPLNNDGTGNPNYQDTDSDDDGILDIDEGERDSDGDGIPDYLDYPDNDQIDENGDEDNDGILNYIEIGSNPENPRNSDIGLLDNGRPHPTDSNKEDRKPDYLDTDSDNNGIPDSVEVGSDPNKPKDTDGDGIYDFQDLDNDGDGISDKLEGTDDYDEDGIPNYQDIDSDGDGVPDNVEATGDYINPASEDKLIQSIESLSDSNNDGTPDYLDSETDLDNDGIPDKVEAGSDPTKTINTDAQDNNPDNNDNLPDYQDPDSDGDGIPDSIEAGNDPNNPVNTDESSSNYDNLPDYRDSDSDGDGIPDSVEAGNDPTNPVNTDLEDNDSDNDDNLPDYLDPDSDGDGIPDSVEAGNDPTNPVNTDLENNISGCVVDQTPDYQDDDSDGDSILDSVEGIEDRNNNNIPNYRECDFAD